MDVAKLSERVQEMIVDIGKAFLFAYYLPVLLFVAFHQYALLPVFNLSGALLPGVPGVPFLSGELLTTLLLPLFLAMLLVNLNTAVVRFFEGSYPWQRRFLLWPWQRTNERKNEELYGKLRGLKREYRNLLVQAETQLGNTEKSPKPAQSAGQASPKWLWFLNWLWKWLSSILAETPPEQKPSSQKKSSQGLFHRLRQTEEEIQAIHERIEARQPTQILPTRTYRVRPTALGNAFAVFEEYPEDRYGIDSTVFWPRLRQVANEKILSAIDNLKMFLDFELNLALLALIFAVEAVAAGIRSGTAEWWIACGLALLISRLSYRASVYVTRSMGMLVNTCFDLYRGKLLEQFGLPKPTSLFEEYKTWLRLGAFLRRGELAHWPGDLYR